MFVDVTTAHGSEQSAGALRGAQPFPTIGTGSCQIRDQEAWGSPDSRFALFDPEPCQRAWKSQGANPALVGERAPVVAISFRFVMCLLVVGLLYCPPQNIGSASDRKHIRACIRASPPDSE